MKNVFLGTILILAFAAPAFAQSPERELAFYKQQAASSDKKLLGALAQNLQSFAARSDGTGQAAAALLLQADIEARLKDFSAAAITLLRHKFEYGPAPKDAVAAVTQGLESGKRAAFERLMNTAVANYSLTQTNLALFLAKATELNLKNSFAPLLVQYEQFFSRFPNYEDNDKLQLMLGDLYRQSNNPRAAVMQYLKVYEVHPSTKYDAAALRMAGDVYAGDLKDYPQAANYYDRVLKEYPASVERGTTYKHMAIMEENRKNYTAAVDYAGQAADIFIKDGAAQKAWDALFYKAELQELRLKDYPAAIATLERAAALSANNQDRFVQAKLRIADIYGKRLKDPYGQITALQAVISAYPSASVMFEAAQLYEKTNDLAKAKALYQKLIVEFPADPLANKAQNRVDAIEKQAAKQSKQ